MGVVLALFAAPAAAAGNEEAVRKCQELLPGFTTQPSRLSIEVQPHGRRTDRRPPGLDGQGRRRPTDGGWIICWFLPRKSDSEAWQLTQVQSSHFGRLSRYDIQQLYKRLTILTARATVPAESDSLEGHLLYVLQQSVNGISLGCVYALIAIGYTLVYGITRVINFAFGEIYMIGAFLALIAYVVIQASGGAMGSRA